MGSVRLRDLIRSIRQCKTAADERAVVNKECAQIRASFREEDSEYRTRNVAKLLYIHMLGYPAHFGQLEVLKLVSSPRFIDKRLGYLGAMMLLDERTDIHLLLTNSIKLDLNSHSQYICCGALCTLGNICSTEMARDLAPEVEKLLKSSNALIRKKATLAACRIIRKDPELMENFLPMIRPLLNERNHGVLLTGTTLLSEMCLVSNDAVEYSRRMVPQLVRILKTLVQSGPTADHDVGGVTDPFLQVKVLRLLGLLGRGNDQASDEMNDILAQVATNTASQKNAGNSVLYEAVRTIMKIRDENGLRVFAINILGKFLLHNDKNIRYVALNTLITCVHDEMQAVQRQRDTIVDCLKDDDISIRRRALELIFALMNNTNIRALTREIFGFLETCETEFKENVCTQLSRNAAKFAPNKRWHVDTVMKILIMSGEYISDDMIQFHAHYFAEMSDMHAYIVKRLYTILQQDISSQPTTQIGVWCMGEFGEMIFDNHVQEEGLVDGFDENDVVDLLETILASSFTSSKTKQMVLTTLLKLSTRFKTQQERIENVINFYSTSMNIELQQRAVEYTSILDRNDIRVGLLERIPIKELSHDQPGKLSEDDLSIRGSRRESTDLLGNTNDGDDDYTQSNGNNTNKSAGADLLDLLSMDDQGGSNNQYLILDPLASMTSNSNNNNNNGLDSLGLGLNSTDGATATTYNNNGDGLGGLLDLLGDSGNSQSQPRTVNPLESSLNNNAADDILGIFGDSGGQLQSQNTNSNTNIKKSDMVYNNHNLKIRFMYEGTDDPNVTMVNVISENNNTSMIDNFHFQAAVPKSIQLVLMPASGRIISPMGGTITQKMKISNPSNSKVRVRMKLVFSLNGQKIGDQTDASDLSI